MGFDVTLAAFLAVIVFVAFATVWGRVWPVLALLAGAAVFALVVNGSALSAAKPVNTGFGQALAAAGLMVLVGLLVARLGELSGGLAALRVRLGETGSRAATLLLAILASPGGSATGALAALTPALRLVEQARTRMTLAAASIITAGQGTLLPSPLPVAAVAVLDADWRMVLALGLPVALVQIGVGLVAAATARERLPPSDLADRPDNRAGLGIALAGVIMVGFVIGHALGQMPSETFGGGPTREALLNLGRPLVGLLIAFGVALLFVIWRRPGLLREDGPLAREVATVAGLMLTIGAAGGLQVVVHLSGLADQAGERAAGLPVAAGLAAPFLVALTIRLIHGSALTAAITAAAIMQPLLVPLGFDSATGRALVVLAVTTGAAAGPHVNDGFWWFACHQAGIGPGEGLVRITAVTLVQAASAFAVLSIAAWALL
jgi:GntP family gluconate:H+ symporter